MNERLLNVSILAGTLVVAVIIGEVAVRKFGRVVMSPTREVTDSLVVFRLKPNVKGRAVHSGVMDYTWTTNAQQLRATRVYAQTKPAGVKRVAAIGDSFTFGIGVNDSETYCALLDTRLNAACADSIEVMNFGVGGTGLSQQVETYERFARGFAPDVVTYGFMTNDINDNLQLPIHKMVGDSAVPKTVAERPQMTAAKRISEMIPGYGWLIAHSALVNGARQAYFVLKRRQASKGADMVENEAKEWRTAQDLNSPQWKFQRALLQRMRREVESQGAKFLVIIMADQPSTNFYYSGEPEKAAMQYGMRQLCTELALQCVDVQEWLTRNAPRANLDTLFIQGDGHYTAAGQVLAARAIEGPLRELLGCPTEVPAIATP